MKLKYNGQFEEKPMTGDFNDAMIYPGEVRDWPEDKYNILKNDPRYKVVPESTPEIVPEFDPSLPIKAVKAKLEIAKMAALKQQKKSK